MRRAAIIAVSFVFGAIFVLVAVCAALFFLVAPCNASGEGIPTPATTCTGPDGLTLTVTAPFDVAAGQTFDNGVDIAGTPGAVLSVAKRELVVVSKDTCRIAKIGLHAPRPPAKGGIDDLTGLQGQQIMVPNDDTVPLDADGKAHLNVTLSAPAAAAGKQCAFEIVSGATRCEWTVAVRAP